MRYAVINDSDGSHAGIIYNEKNDDIVKHHQSLGQSLEVVENLIRNEEKDQDGNVINVTFTPTAKSTETQIAEIKQRLYEVDLESIRAIRAIQRNVETQDDIDKLETLENEATALRQQLASLS